MQRESLITIIILSFCCSFTQGLFISRDVQAGDSFCLREDLPRHTLTKIDILSQGEFDFEFKEGMMVVFAQPVGPQGFSRSITTQKYGTHSFCFVNRGEQSSRVKIQIAVGKHANDYGSSVGSEDLVGSLQNQARIAQQFIQDIVKQNTEGMQIMVAEDSHHFQFSNFYFLSGGFAIATLVLTFIQFRNVYKYLHTRKYI